MRVQHDGIERRWRWAALVALLCALPAIAGGNGALDPHETDIVDSPGFLTYHPDLKGRSRGTRAYSEGRFADAMTQFRLAARYADKPSQAMIAEMLWQGDGIPRDPALAYAWMDLAAERGYRDFLILRERYWAALDVAQREDAVRRGSDVYAAFGDAVARPRIDAALRRGRNTMTGSRTGFGGSALVVSVPGPGGQMQQIDGSLYYADRFWDPAQYQAWQDAIWMAPRRERVDVGAPEVMPAPASRTADD